MQQPPLVHRLDAIFGTEVRSKDVGKRRFSVGCPTHIAQAHLVTSSASIALLERCRGPRRQVLLCPPRTVSPSRHVTTTERPEKKRLLRRATRGHEGRRKRPGKDGPTTRVQTQQACGGVQQPPWALPAPAAALQTSMASWRQRLAHLFIFFFAGIPKSLGRSACRGARRRKRIQCRLQPRRRRSLR